VSLDKSSLIASVRDKAVLAGAFSDPHKAVQQAYNRTSNFSYGMVYIAYFF